MTAATLQCLKRAKTTVNIASRSLLFSPLIATVDRDVDFTPTSGRSSLQHDSEDVHAHAQGEEHEEDAATPQGVSQGRKRAYNSRVEQIIFENDDLIISITHAGKNTEGGGSYIAYTIRTGVCGT